MALSFLYHLGVLGSPSTGQLADLEAAVSRTVEALGLRLGREVGWAVGPEEFNPDPQAVAAAAFFGGTNAPVANLGSLLARRIPLLPVVSKVSRVNAEMPEMLRELNCLAYDEGGAQRTATALLECASLLPKQRRVFLSYRRDEARDAAVQLFEAFSARLFGVFLDTHGIAPGDEFQASLWHQLCDCDVLVMLDTPKYFESRWTNAEFGRALAKGISVLRVGWPDATPSARTATASRAELLPTDVDAASGRLSDSSVGRICTQLESVRTQSYAVRRTNLISNLEIAVERIGGTILGVGSHAAIHVRLPDGPVVLVYPAVGVPTSRNLHQAFTNASQRSAAVLYDHIGLLPEWLGHLDWLGGYIRTPRWVKASEAAWRLADWRS